MKKNLTKLLLILLIPFVLFLSEAFTQRPMGGGPIGGGGGGPGGLADVVEDVTPQLGGNLDIQTFSIEGVDATEFGYLDGITGDIQTQLNAAGGDVESMGDCLDGACGDGSSDGGTYLRLYDGDSHYLEINPGNLAANETFDPTDDTGTGPHMNAHSPTVQVTLFTPQITMVGSDADPDEPGEMRYDTVVTAYAGGAFKWYDNDGVRIVLDTDTEPGAGDDDKVWAYDWANKKNYLKVDADSGGATDYENIGDPSGDGSIDMGAHTGTHTSATEAWDGMIIESRDVDNAGDTTLLTLKHYDDFDENSIFLSCINDSDGGADNIFRVFGLGFIVGEGAPGETMTGDDGWIFGFLGVEGPIYALGGIVSSDTDPEIVLDDLDGANSFWAVQAADADDAVATLGVDDSNGDKQPYIKMDGVDEEIELLYPVLSITSSYTIITPQELSVETEDDVTVGTELTSSLVYLTGDDDGDHDTLTLQDGIIDGTILTFVVADVCDDSDTLIIDAETDSTCTGCPDAGIFTFDDPGDKVTLNWNGTASAWFYMGSYAVD